MMVDLWMQHMLMMIILIALMQGPLGRQRQKTRHCMLSVTKQVISTKLATAVGHILRDLDLKNVYMAWTPCLMFNVFSNTV